MKYPFISALALCSLLTCGTASAHTVTYSGIFADETGTGSSGSGEALITVDLDLFTMRVQFDFADLTGNTTASHIHCCTSVPGSGNAGVASETPSFPFPFGVTAGTFDQLYDLSAAASYNASFIANNGGTPVSAGNALILGLDEGRAYVNIHTSTSPGGEVRAWLAPAPVPLPAAAWMLVPALGTMLLRRRRTG